MTFKISTIALAGALTLATAACGNPDEVTEPEQASDATAGMDHSEHGMGGDTGHAKGTVVSVASGELGITHGPIDGVGMDAMTMLFGTMGDVDATAFKVGDEVSFMVKRGRDGSYRVIAICNTALDGEDCLDPQLP